MGNITSFFTKKRNNDNQQKKVDFILLDKYSKKELIDYIQKLNTKSINLTDNFQDQLKNMEIETTALIPMCIELYEKMFETFGEYKKIADNNKITKKKIYFVKPKFSTDQVKSTLEIKTVSISYPLDNSLVKIPFASTTMNMNDITIDELNDSFNANIAKKDMIGMSKKILKDLPQYLKLRFINSFNQILNDTSKVNMISLGRASYIYKAAKHGPTNDINSFRQILAIPNFVNQFHRILGIRLNDYLQKNNYIDTNIQKGGVSGNKFALFEQFYKIKNILKHANKNKKSCAILFLDISNAFGNLNLANLYKILELYNVDKKFIDYLKEFYSNFEYYVDTNDIKTGNYKWNDGLIQGCSLSPLLFIFSLNYIFTYLDIEYKKNYGYDIDGITKILLTAYVDDICIICKDIVSLEIVYKKLVELLKMLGLPINKDKCALMIINDNTQINSDLNNVQKVNVFKYLGEYISSDGTNTESYIQFIRTVSRKLKIIDVKNIPDSDKLKIFDICVMPWIQRKTLAMYDITVTHRLKIISIIKPYLDKWGNNDIINIFSSVASIIEDSKDNIISKVQFDNQTDDDLEQNIEISNYVFKNNISIEYTEIDDDYKLDKELADFETLTN